MTVDAKTRVIKSATSAQWTAAGAYTPADGELVHDKTNGAIEVGDGITAHGSLPGVRIHGQRKATTGINGVAGTNWGPFSVTWPTGLFTAAPAVQVTIEVGAAAANRLYAVVANGTVTTSGCDLRVLTATGGSLTPTLDPVIDVVAVAV